MAWRPSEDDGNEVPSPARLPSVGEGQGEGATNCLDEETLVAYSEAELTAAEAARAEQHLRQCTRCVNEVQRLIQLRTAMGLAPQVATLAVWKRSSSFLSLWERVGVRARALPVRFRDWMESIGASLAKPWPALGAVAATALLVLVVVRFLPGGADVQFRSIPRPVKVEIAADNAIARARPSDAEPIIATLGRSTQATRLEQSGEWTRIELPDGRRVWVRSVQLSGVLPRPPGESAP